MHTGLIPLEKDILKRIKGLASVTRPGQYGEAVEVVKGEMRWRNGEVREQRVHTSKTRMAKYLKLAIRWAVNGEGKYSTYYFIIAALKNARIVAPKADQARVDALIKWARGWYEYKVRTAS